MEFSICPGLFCPIAVIFSVRASCGSYPWELPSETAASTITVYRLKWVRYGKPHLRNR